MHSGLQLGGDPKKFGRHEQVAWLLEEIVHWALSPQGEGLQGSFTGSSTRIGRKMSQILIFNSPTRFCLCFFVSQLYLLIWKQLTNGSPVNRSGQLQIGLWFRTVQRALSPHELSQGFTHFMFTQARVCSQSVLTVHSALQPGGRPMKPGSQEQEACWPKTRHKLLGPQGEGSQGLVLVVDSKSKGRGYRFVSSYIFLFADLSLGGLTFFWVTDSERVAAKTWITIAAEQVVNHRTLGILTANSRTGIDTFVIGAGHGQGTLGVLYTFGSATGVGVALVSTDTSTDSVSALGIGSTGRGVALVNRSWTR